MKRPWCWERLNTGANGDDRGWDGWIASPTQRPWVWVNSGSWWWTVRPGVLWSMGLQRAGHNWVTELDWTELSHPHMTAGKTTALTRWTFVGKVMSLLFNMLCKLIIAFLSRSKHLLISWLQSPCAVILEPPQIKSVTVSTVSPSMCHALMGPDAMILVFWMLSFKPIFALSFFTFIKRLVLCFLSKRWYNLHIWGYWYFSQQSWFQLVFPPVQHFSWCTLHIS